MKFAQLAIGIIISIEAFLLLYSPQQRYNFHNFIQTLKSNLSCECLSSWGYECIEQLRFIVIAIMVSGAYSLTLGNNVVVGIVAQLLWVVTQEKFCWCGSLKDIRNLIVQIFLLVVLIGELCKECRQCSQQKKLRHQQQNFHHQQHKPVKKNTEKKELTKQSMDKSQAKQANVQVQQKLKEKQTKATNSKKQQQPKNSKKK